MKRPIESSTVAIPSAPFPRAQRTPQPPGRWQQLAEKIRVVSADEKAERVVMPKGFDVNKTKSCLYRHLRAPGVSLHMRRTGARTVDCWITRKAGTDSAGSQP